MEIMLISKRMPRGKQIATHVSSVNVPTKASYKGHYMYQSVRPDKMAIALKLLKENNPLYSDIDVADDVCRKTLI